jgi:hypothetical protein
VAANQNVGSLSEDDRRHLCELDWQTSAVLQKGGEKAPSLTAGMHYPLSIDSHLF